MRQIIDVDDFTRHYLAMETPPSDRRWQTAHMWAKLLNAVTAGAGTGASAADTSAKAGGRTQNHISPSSLCKRVTSNGDAAAHSRSDGDSFDELFPPENGTMFSSPPGSTSGGRAPFRDSHNVDGGSNRNSATIFAHLWGGCIGDDTCAAFACSEKNPSTLPGGTENDDEANALHPASSSQPPQEQPASPPRSSHHHHLGPWERLVGALRDDRGIDVSRLLSDHEFFLLEREVTDWINRAQGRQRAEPGRGKGMAERLALAAGAALHQKGTMSAAATPERPHDGAALPDGARGGGGGETADVGSTATATAATAAAVEEGHRGGIPNHSRRHLPVEDVHFPMVVVEEGSNKGDAASRIPTATAGGESDGSGAGTTASRPQKIRDRPLDLLGVASDAHEVCAAASSCAREKKLSVYSPLVAVFGVCRVLSGFPTRCFRQFNGGCTHKKYGTKMQCRLCADVGYSGSTWIPTKHFMDSHECNNVDTA